MGDNEMESPDENLVTRLQCCLIDPGVIDIRPVGRPAVLDDEAVVIGHEPAVLT
jgi:hypothetical protein